MRSNPACHRDSGLLTLDSARNCATVNVMLLCHQYKVLLDIMITGRSLNLTVSLLTQPSQLLFSAAPICMFASLPTVATAFHSSSHQQNSTLHILALSTTDKLCAFLLKSAKSSTRKIIESSKRYIVSLVNSGNELESPVFTSRFHSPSHQTQITKLPTHSYKYQINCDLD